MKDLQSLQITIDNHRDIGFSDDLEAKDFFPESNGLAKRIKNFIHKARLYGTIFLDTKEVQCPSYAGRSIRDIAIYIREPIEDVIKCILEVVKEAPFDIQGCHTRYGGFYCYTTSQFIIHHYHLSCSEDHNNIYFNIPGYGSDRSVAPPDYREESLEWFETFADLTGDNGYIPI